jgi:hypothetical protein
MKTSHVWLLLIPLLFMGCSTSPSKPTTATDSTHAKTATPSATNNAPSATAAEWKKIEQNHQAVWADDGSDVATVLLNYEEKPGNSKNAPAEKRNFKHQLFVQKPDGKERHQITGMRDYKSGALYYMKQAEYFVLESLLDNGARRFDKISPKGNEILIMETPETSRLPTCPAKKGTKTPESLQIAQTVIPSPDGKLLANIYSPECGQISVEFLYANNLNFIDSKQLAVTEPVSALWHPEGYILLVSQDMKHAWQVTLQGQPTATTPPRCISPVTTSSNIAATGDMIYFKDNVLATQKVGRENVFGCH